MVIGNGLIANEFKKGYENDDNIVILASGVSNSQEENEENFKKEKELISTFLEKNKEKYIIYFSSIFVLSKKNKYYKHKLFIERLIKKSVKKFMIIRLPQILGNIGNKNNLINYIKNKILNCEYVDIEKNSTRSIVDVKDVYLITNFLIKNNKVGVYNLSYIELKSVIEITNYISEFLGKSPKINLLDNTPIKHKKNSLIINNFINENINIENYTKKIIEKYI